MSGEISQGVSWCRRQTLAKTRPLRLIASLLVSWLSRDDKSLHYIHHCRNTTLADNPACWWLPDVSVLQQDIFRETHTDHSLQSISSWSPQPEGWLEAKEGCGSFKIHRRLSYLTSSSLLVRHKSYGFPAEIRDWPSSSSSLIHVHLIPSASVIIPKAKLVFFISFWPWYPFPLCLPFLSFHVLNSMLLSTLSRREPLFNCFIGGKQKTIVQLRPVTWNELIMLIQDGCWKGGWRRLPGCGHWMNGIGCLAQSIVSFYPVNKFKFMTEISKH